jgi:hypothetical protein
VPLAHPVEGPDGAFEVSGLALGSWSVVPAAPGWTGRAALIALDARRDNQYATLRLFPAGFLEGSVLDADGAPAEGVGVRLEPLGAVLALGEEPRATRTGTDGRFRFDALPDGEYEVRVGQDESALLPPRRVAFRAPSLRMPPVTLAGGAELEVQVLDPSGVGVAEARVVVEGPGGTRDVRADHEGRARLRRLPAGEVRVSASVEGLQGAQVELRLEVGEQRSVTVQLR